MPHLDPAKPLSPHLQVYRLPLLAVMSILHRITGVALVGGSILVVAWLTAGAMGEDAFACAQAVIGSIPGQIVLAGFTTALFYHFFNGVRHMAWDMLIGLELGPAYASGYAVWAATAVCTIATFAAAYGLGG